jgi:pimeloyl-ACP methyl ester carboxylesterase
MGLGAQLTLWPEDLCHKLVAKGFYVIRYDNRDVGLSTKLDAAGVPDMPSIFAGKAKPPYTLDDMAADAAALLDALGVEKAHIVGASMGGMIAQLVAANHPEKTLSLTSIMSTTGNPAVPPATPEAMQALTTRLPADTPMDALVDHAVKTYGVIGSPIYSYDTPVERARIRAGLERSIYPAGFARQMAAIVANGDRREKLKGVTAPTVVIHGAADPLVNVAGGKDTAASIKGAELIVIPDMGHDLPPFTLDQVVDAIVTVAGKA